MKSRRFTLTFVAALAFCLAAAAFAPAQGLRRPMRARAAAQAAGQGNSLVRLENALQAASAAALSSDQETQINALITSFRSSHTPPTPDPAVQSARTAFDSAILGGSYDAASANTILQARASNEATRMQELGNFAVSVVKVLSKDQINSLVTKFGAPRVVALIESMSFPGRGPGRGVGMGMGMGMGRGPAVR